MFIIITTVWKRVQAPAQPYVSASFTMTLSQTTFISPFLSPHTQDFAQNSQSYTRF